MIVLTGESHLGAIRRGTSDVPESVSAAITYWPLGAGGPVATPFFEHDADAARVCTNVSGWRNRIFSKDTLTFNGAQALVALSIPLNTSRILRDYSWHKHVPWQLQKARKEIALSDAVVDSVLEQDYRHALAFVAALIACDIKVVVIEGPHFFGKAPYLKRCRLDVCAYIDALYRKIVTNKLDAMGVDVIVQRPETLDDVGRTKPEFGHENPNDTHHANAEFGAMIFAEVVTYGKAAGFV